MGGCRPANLVASRLHTDDLHAGVGVAARQPARGIRADEIARHDIAARSVHVDALIVGRNQIARPRCGSTDRVGGRIKLRIERRDVNAVTRIAVPGGTIRFQTDEATLDAAARAAGDPDAVAARAAKAHDAQAAHDAVWREEFEAIGVRRGVRAAEDDPDDGVVAVIQFIHSHTKPNKLFLMGFSQGTIMSLGTALHLPELVSGVLGFSGRFERSLLPDQPNMNALRKLAVFQSHGVSDPVIPVTAGRDAKKILEEYGVNLTYREYPFAHEISMNCLKDAMIWLKEVL